MEDSLTYVGNQLQELSVAVAKLTKEKTASKTRNSDFIRQTRILFDHSIEYSITKNIQ